MYSDTNTLDFTQEPLAYALAQVQRGRYATAHPELTPEQKALVYYYTYDGSEDVNRPLYESNGQPTVLSQKLAAALKPLPKHLGLVYSAAYWEPKELSALRLQAAAGGPPLHVEIKTWPAFLSASRSELVAREYLGYERANCFLYVTSQTGRQVDLLSHYGPNGSFHDDREVLFLPNTQFRVINVLNTTSFPEIELLEV